MATTANSCGMAVFQVSDEVLLERALVLGNEGATYYAGADERRVESMACLDRLLASPAGRDAALSIISRCDAAGKCPRKGPLVWALARCCNHGKAEAGEAGLAFRRRAYAAALDVLRTGSDLLAFCALSKSWNNLQKAFVRAWLGRRGSAVDVAYQFTKYQRREGYAVRDVLRLAHVKAEDGDMSAVLRFAARGELPEDPGADAQPEAVRYLAALERLRAIRGADGAAAAADLIRRWRFVREHVPPELLGQAAVWRAMIDNGMPATALLRSLNRLTLAGVFESPELVDSVARRLEDHGAMQRARVHPIQLLVALKTYAAGKGLRGSLQWQPVQRIVDALDRGFYAMFEHLEPINKRLLVAVDVSGSMGGSRAAGAEALSCREAATALAMVFQAQAARADERGSCTVMAFSGGFVPLDVCPRRRMDDNVRAVQSLPFDSTDISVPFDWARRADKLFDAFVVLTDSETNSNRVPPADALRQYRAATGIDARLAVVAFEANRFSVADPSDPGMLDVVGLDASVPEVVRGFVRGFVDEPSSTPPPAPTAAEN